MDETSLDRDLLRALRRAPGSSLGELAEAVGIGRTNFGRRLTHPVRAGIERLHADGLVEQRGRRYRLSERGRRRVADDLLDAPR